jgi:uncharacterized membrane protein
MSKFHKVALLVYVASVLTEIAIYYSDLDFKYNHLSFEINAGVILVGVVLIGTLTKPFWTQALVTVSLLIGSGTIWFVLLFVNGFSCQRKMVETWKIDSYKISYENSQYWAGPGDEMCYRLQRNYVFGLFNEDMDKVYMSDTNHKGNVYFLRENEGCIVAFDDVDLRFDLCELQRLQ